MDYLWDNEKIPDYPALSGDTTADVAVIGGGMAGVLCAYRLQEAGADCIVIDGDVPGCGTTRGTTAVLTAQHSTLYSDLIAKRGEAAARRYLRANLRAAEQFRALSEKSPCNFETRPSCMYTCGTAAEYQPERLYREAQAVRALDFPAEFVRDAGLPFQTCGAVVFPNMAQFHPLRFLHGIARGLHIFARTYAERIDLKTNTVHTSRGRIRAKKIVVATHFPFFNRRGLYFAKLYQTRSYVAALGHAPQLPYTYVGTGESSLYFRTAGDLLLVGGGDHRTGKGKPGGGADWVLSAAKRLFPLAEPRLVWAAQDCMSLDGVPDIGRYRPHTPDLFVATGFSEWGMTTAMLAAELLTAQICRGASEDIAFSPQRSSLHPQLFLNLWESAVHLLRPTVPRCPHLGCALIWNKSEHSWDCACHGSRFSALGTPLENPAVRGINPRKTGMRR